MKELEIFTTQFVYPNYNIHTGFVPINSLGSKVIYEYHILIESYIRKKKDDIWYLIPLIQRFATPIQNEKSKPEIVIQSNEKLFHQFIASAYMIQLFYIINPDIYALDNSPLLYIDANQQSEEERLKPRI